MKTSTPILLAFEENAVRIIPDAEKPLFVAKDVALALGYKEPEVAVRTHCKGGANYTPLSTKGGQQEIRVIDEPDVYRLIFGSKLESAKRFQDWVFEEVLPAIRKSGGYGVLSPADEIRYMNQRLALLRELRHERDPLLLEKLHELFKTVSDRLGYDTPALDAFAPRDPNDALDERTRQTLARFWAAVETLEQLGVVLNHSRASDRIAINLNEALRLADEHGVAMPGRIELLRALPQSCEPCFMAASHSMTSNLCGRPRTVRCYLFRKTAV